MIPPKTPQEFGDLFQIPDDMPAAMVLAMMATSSSLSDFYECLQAYKKLSPESVDTSSSHV